MKKYDGPAWMSEDGKVFANEEECWRYDAFEKLNEFFKGFKVSGGEVSGLLREPLSRWVAENREEILKILRK